MLLNLGQNTSRLGFSSLAARPQRTNAQMQLPKPQIGASSLLFGFTITGLILQVIVIYVIQHPSTAVLERRYLQETDQDLSGFPVQVPAVLEVVEPASQPSIFVSLASYRDSECSHTIEELFRKAQYPQRVSVGICQAVRLANESCISDSSLTNSIRLITLPFFEAKGPTHARHLVSTLYRGEDYWFQLDSHSNLTDGWDVKLTTMLEPTNVGIEVLVRLCTPEDFGLLAPAI